MDDTKTEPALAPCPLYAWVLKGSTPDGTPAYGIPAIMIQKNQGPPEPLSLVFTKLQDAQANRELAQNLATGMRSSISLIGIAQPEVVEVLEPKHIVTAAPGQLLGNRAH